MLIVESIERKLYDNGHYCLAGLLDGYALSTMVWYPVLILACHIYHKKLKEVSA